MIETEELLSIKEASEWATAYLGKTVTTSNISYLIQYGRIKKIGSNGTTQVSKQELIHYYKSFNEHREFAWRDQLGSDLNWALSFDQYKEAETTKHVHRLHPYKGKFIPQLVEYFLDSHTDNFKTETYFKKDDIVLDPFSGSGTTMVQACELGMHAIGIDISAFNTLIGNCKVTKYDITDVQIEIKRVTKALKEFLTNSHTLEFEEKLLNSLYEFNNEYFPVPEYKYKLRQGEINEEKYGAAKENAFTDLQIRNLFLTNPHAGRSDYILEILANRNTPFPPTYLDRIIESADSITSRDSLAWMVSDANRNYDLLLNDVVGWYFDDTLERISTLDSLLTHPYNPMYRYQLAALYFERGLYTNYQNVLDSIPAQIVLTDRELIWHQTFNDLYDQIKIWKQDSFPLPLLDSGQLVWMKEFYEEHPEMPGIGHALLSVNDTSYSHTDPVYINDTTAYTPPPSPFVTNDISNIGKTHRLKVYPNPSDRKIHFEWLSSEPLPKGTLIRIYDQSGKKAGEWNWDVSSKVLTIDLNYLPSGIYYASMLHGQKQIEIQRILLQR